MCIINVTDWGDCAEGQDTAGGDGVFDKASFNELGMNLLKVFHGVAFCF